jgi:P-type E1-E2 ATPase
MRCRLNFASTPGVGFTARLGGSTITVGAPARLLKVPDADSAAARATVVAGELEASGHTAVLVQPDSHPVGVLGIADRLRDDAAATVTALGRLTGISPMLLTGDNPRAAARLAVEVGITDVRAGLLPQEKVTAVKELEQAGRRVLVVGDGVNDAPALAAAHTGIAMGRAGSDLAAQLADLQKLPCKMWPPCAPSPAWTPASTPTSSSSSPPPKAAAPAADRSGSAWSTTLTPPPTSLPG